jgi:putative acetyltransferase
MTLEIRPEHPQSDVAKTLIDELNESIWERYPDMRPSESDQYKGRNILSADTPFFVAYLDREPIGCGAYRPVNAATVEIKRMYVRRTLRQQGIGRAMLRFLEEAARAAGYTTARLETGTAQTEALALYEKDGYERIPCWPPYDALPVSICLAKPLA